MQPKSTLAFLAAFVLLAPITFAQSDGGTARHGDRPEAGGDEKPSDLGDQPGISSGHSDQGGSRPPHGYGDARKSGNHVTNRLHP